MSTGRAPVERVLDVVVFAPIGAVMVLGGAVRLAAERAPLGGFRERLCSAAAMARGMLQAAGATSERHDGPDAGDGSPDAASVPATYDAPDVSELAIEGYDHLAARQVVDRLEGLAPVELDRVERYESANRRRRTVLGKIEQLRS